jgi:hypothetical protein
LTWQSPEQGVQSTDPGEGPDKDLKNPGLHSLQLTELEIRPSSVHTNFPAGQVIVVKISVS